MPVSLDQFAQQVVEAGLMSADDVGAVVEGVRASEPPHDAEQLARLLVREKKLTAFQAQQLYSGKGKGLVLGNYLILDKLGQGGMGMVLKAEHRRMKRIVALKVLSPAVTKSPEATRRFQREVEAAAKLDHPNIVTAYDADAANGTHFLVMQYVEGTDLSVLVRENGPLTVEKALPCVLQAARGLQYAHSRGVVHRDIKPANLLVDREGTVKILDMGLARLDSAGGEQDQLTGTGQIMGTVDYMAPEQAMDTKTADARADVYSLGVTLWYLLTGRAVYTGDSMAQKLMAHQNKPIPSLHSACPSASPELEAIFVKMVAKTPESRYQSMAEVIVDLERCQGGFLSKISAPAATGHDRNLSEFLSGLQSSGGATVTAKPAAKSISVASSPFEQTVTYQSPDADTNPQMRTTPTSRKAARLAKRSLSSRACWKSRKTLIAAGAGALALLLWAGIVFFVQTKDGFIRVEIDDPLIEVSIKGTTIVLKQADKGKDVKISAGDHILIVRRGDFKFETDTLILRKDKTVTVKVELLPGKIEVHEGETLLGQGQLPSVWQDWPADAPPPAIAPFDAKQARAHQEAWAKYLKVQVEYSNSIGMKFVLIPPGEFMMGSTPEEIEAVLKIVGGDKHWRECAESEGPLHRVFLTQAFFLGVHEVTQAQYNQVMGKNPAHFAPQGAGKGAVAGMDTTRFPVEMVSWNDAAEFCAKLSQQEKLKPYYSREDETVTLLGGTGYRLPSEAEWEFACRAGTTTRYWGGDKDQDLARAGWFGSNSGRRTHAVGELSGNPFGLYDVHGNVWEWVQDGWKSTAYRQFAEQPASDPSSPFAAGLPCAIRSGSWHNFINFSRASCRHAGGPTGGFNDIGFRAVLSVAPVKQAVENRAANQESGRDHALRFSGAEERLEIPDLKIPSSGPWTVEGWVTPRAPLPNTGGSSSAVFLVADAALVVKNVGTQGIKWSAGGPAKQLPPAVFSSNNVELDKRVHVALTSGSEGVSFYLDGVLQGQPLQLHTSGKETSLSVCRPDAKFHKVPFHGDFDEIRVSSVSRYRENFTPKPRFESDVDTIVLYHFDEGQGETIGDSTGHKRDGRISGAKWVSADALPTANAP